MSIVTVVCSRCGREVTGLLVEGGTSGFYEGPYWQEKYMRPGETILCDDCMHHEPRYRAAYGLGENE